jgi:hypothetical protein
LSIPARLGSFGFMDFVDLQGASGQVYRFRRWPDGGHPPIAGNYAVVRRRDHQLVALGVSENLAEAQTKLTRLEGGLEAFTRLNVSRAHREAEHADLSTAYPRSTPQPA